MQNTLKTPEPLVAERFPYERIEQEKQPFWYHSIERHEKPGELEKLVIFCILGLVVVGTICYFAGGK